MTSGSLHPVSRGEMRRCPVAFTGSGPWGVRNKRGPGGRRACGQEHDGGRRGFLGESLEGEGTHHFPAGPSLTCRKQRCIQGDRKSGRGQPAETCQSKVDFMPGGSRTNQAQPFCSQNVSVLPCTLKTLAIVAGRGEPGRLGELWEGGGGFHLMPFQVVFFFVFLFLNFESCKGVTCLKH